MVKFRLLNLLPLLLLWFSAASHGATFPDTPPNEHFFVDSAHIMAEESKAEVDRIASALLEEHVLPLYVVTIPSLASHEASSYSIERYATELFDHWGIGSQQRNYGMLLFISLEDRKARIELGKSWDTAQNLNAQRVMNNLIIPAFKQGDFELGIVDGVRGLDAMARGLDLPVPKPPAWHAVALIGGIFLVVLMIINLFKTGRSGWAWALIIALGAFLFFMLRSTASSGGGSSGGFGGGSSGGGGATGSW